MLKKSQDYAGWAMLMYELDDAREALEKLVNEMNSDSDFSEEGLKIDLGHIYGHLNRAWYIRNGEKGTNEERDSQIKFPTDIEPI